MSSQHTAGHDRDERLAGDRGDLVPPDLTGVAVVVWRCPHDGCTTAERGTLRRPSGVGVCGEHRLALRRVPS